MDTRRMAFLTAALFAALAGQSSSAPPPGAELRDATIAVGFESKNHCPDLIQADAQEPSAALVVLVVGPSGVPSQPSLKSSSGSETLDAAALSCVMKLRFLPAVRAGEGSAMASWQEIAWKWGRGHFAQNAAPGGVAVAAASMPVAGAVAAAGAAHAGAGGAEVRVCADDGGKLTQDPALTRSSGDAALDEAALRIARAGAPYYRPAGAAAVSGCAQLAIKFEAK